jgi:hypothetical protein
LQHYGSSNSYDYTDGSTSFLGGLFQSVQSFLSEAVEITRVELSYRGITLPSLPERPAASGGNESFDVLKSARKNPMAAASMDLARHGDPLDALFPQPHAPHPVTAPVAAAVSEVPPTPDAVPVAPADAAPVVAMIPPPAAAIAPMTPPTPKLSHIDFGFAQFIGGPKPLAEPIADATPAPKELVDKEAMRQALRLSFGTKRRNAEQQVARTQAAELNQVTRRPSQATQEALIEAQSGVTRPQTTRFQRTVLLHEPNVDLSPEPGWVQSLSPEGLARHKRQQYSGVVAHPDELDSAGHHNPSEDSVQMLFDSYQSLTRSMDQLLNQYFTASPDA